MSNGEFLLPKERIYIPDNKNLFFTSDTHFGHGNILKYCDRPWLSEQELDLLEIERANPKDPRKKLRVSRESIASMDNQIVDNINNAVGEDDWLVHAGDFCMGGRKHTLENIVKYRRRIKCKNVIIIMGNHDDRKAFSAARHYFTEVFSDRIAVFYRGQGIVTDHYAMAIWLKNHRGMWHLYGHSHANAEVKLEIVFPGRKSMDCGVDNAARILGEGQKDKRPFYAPFSFEIIKNIMDRKTGIAIDHHEER